MSEETVNLKYGNRSVVFKKSKNLIAIKPSPGMEPRLRAVLSNSGNAKLVGNDLGGFKIVQVEGSPSETNEKLDALRLNPGVASGSHVFHTSSDNVPFVPTGSIFLEFKSDSATKDREALIGDQKLQIVEARGPDTLLVKTTQDSANPLKVAAQLQESPLVSIAEPEMATPGKLKAFALPSDSLLSEQWHLENTGRHRGTKIGFKTGADARVVAAWKVGRSLGSPSVVIAIIDDGFDLKHPDLNAPGKIVAPWDFTRNTNQPVPDIESSDWHGSACAGVATGASGGGCILGAAPDCTLMPVRWGPDITDTEIEKWFGYVTDNGAWIVSCSWGAEASYFPLSKRAERAITRCADKGRGGKGCVIVFAAGNSSHNIDDPAHGTLDGFAIHPDVIAVAASTSKDERSHYSNFGHAISVCAPSSGAGGWGILTSDVTGTITVGGITKFLGYAPGDYTYDFGGTSSSCPLVAGVCALVLTANPSLTTAEVRKVLQQTARKIGDPAQYNDGRSKWFGYGCVDAEAAVRMAGSLLPKTAAKKKPHKAKTTVAA
jgi:subtilisin family serine protease